MLTPPTLGVRKPPSAGSLGSPVPWGAGAAPQFIPPSAPHRDNLPLPCPKTPGKQPQLPPGLRAAPTPGFNNKWRGKGQRRLAGGRRDAGWQRGPAGGEGAGMWGWDKGDAKGRHQPRSFVGLEGSGSQRCSTGFQPRAAHHDVSSLKQIPLAELG